MPLNTPIAPILVTFPDPSAHTYEYGILDVVEYVFHVRGWLCNDLKLST